MWGLIVSAFARVTSWFFGATTIKWAVMALLWFGLAGLIDYMVQLLPTWLSTGDLTASTSAFTPEIWFFMDYFTVSTGLGMILSAYAVRFTIRRLPFIG